MKTIYSNCFFMVLDERMHLISWYLFSSDLLDPNLGFFENPEKIGSNRPKPKNAGGKIPA